MHIISRRALRDFWTVHPESKAPLAAWFRVLARSEFVDFNALRRTFASADYVAPFTIFNVAGNRYRVVTVVHYNRRKTYVRLVLTHTEYDRWCASRRSRKQS